MPFWQIVSGQIARPGGRGAARHDPQAADLPRFASDVESKKARCRGTGLVRTERLESAVADRLGQAAFSISLTEGLSLAAIAGLATLPRLPSTEVAMDTSDLPVETVKS